jgi:hypothetical protein
MRGSRIAAEKRYLRKSVGISSHLIAYSNGRHARHVKYDLHFNAFQIHLKLHLETSVNSLETAIY